MALFGYFGSVIEYEELEIVLRGETQIILQLLEISFQIVCKTWVRHEKIHD